MKLNPWAEKSKTTGRGDTPAEDDVADLAKYIPVERILFGSDWPHTVQHRGSGTHRAGQRPRTDIRRARPVPF